MGRRMTMIGPRLATPTALLLFVVGVGCGVDPPSRETAAVGGDAGEPMTDGGVADSPAPVDGAPPVDAGPDAADAAPDASTRPGLVVGAPVPGTRTLETGSSITLTAALNAKPLASVTVPLSVSKPGEAQVSPASLTFDATSWNVPQTITVTGKDDGVADGDQPYDLVLAALTSADPSFAGVDPPDLALESVEDAPVGIVFSEAMPSTRTTEAGGKITFTVHLRSKPIAAVQLAVYSNVPTEGKPDKTSVTFTPESWNVPQTITVTGQADLVCDDDKIYGIYVGPAVSADLRYKDIEAAIALENADDPTCPDWADISAGQGPGSGRDPSAVVDAVNGKLLVATHNEGNDGKPSIFRCNLDGTGCTHTDVSSGKGNYSGRQPKLLLDRANGKLLLVTDRWVSTPTAYPTLFRCNLDVTGCAASDISGMGSINDQDAVLDTINGKLLVVRCYSPGNGGSLPWLHRCNLDGTACTDIDISAGQSSANATKCFYPSLVVDEARGKLLVVTGASTATNDTEPGLFRCDLDGSGCVFGMLGASPSHNSGWYPSAVLDTKNDKLLVATFNSWNASLDKTSLFRCAPDGSACTHTDLSAAFGPKTAGFPSAVIDTVHDRLLVAIDNAANGRRPSLFRCNLDGSACTLTDLSLGRGINSGYFPSAVLDVANNRVRVVTTDDSPDRRRRLSLWSDPLK